MGRSLSRATALLAMAACGAGAARLSSAPAPMSVVPPASASASGSASGSASAVASATASAPASSAAVVAARHSAPYEGLYFISADRNTTCALLGRWLSCLALDTPDGRRQPLLLAVSVDGTMLKPLRDGVAPPFTLGAPAGAGGRWALRAPSGVALTQRSDPYLARIEEHLAGQVFVRLETKLAPRPGDVPEYSKDTITMADALVATVALEAEHDCKHAVLFPDPTWNRSIPLGPAAPSPAAGALGMRTFALMKLELECAEAVDPRGSLGLHGILGGVKLFADADGEPVGLLLEGYMYAEIFATRGATGEAIGRMFTAVAAERGRQAE